jgi:hypothetical protein
VRGEVKANYCFQIKGVRSDRVFLWCAAAFLPSARFPALRALLAILHFFLIPFSRQARDAAGLNTRDPPLFNTITVPRHTWAVIQFTADNPGFWTFHCHVTDHAARGQQAGFVDLTGTHSSLSSFVDRAERSGRGAGSPAGHVILTLHSPT